MDTPTSEDWAGLTVSSPDGDAKRLVVSFNLPTDPEKREAVLAVIGQWLLDVHDNPPAARHLN